MSSRREFLKKTSIVAVGGSVGVSLISGCRPSPATGQLSPVVGDDGMALLEHPTADAKALAATAIEAAVAAGALYADVRLTVRHSLRYFYSNPPTRGVALGVGVRALVNGSWGFVASGIWTSDEMARLGRAAVAQARANTWANSPPVQFDQDSRGGPPAIGEWSAPVQRDPLTVAPTETMDFCQSILGYASRYRNASASINVNFGRLQKTFASSEGALCTQTVFDTFGSNSLFSFTVVDPVTYRSVQRRIPLVTPTGAGYEMMNHTAFLAAIDQAYEEGRQQLTAIAAPNTRCDIVLDSVAMASVLNHSVGAALEVDRSLGYEANAYGTSYLSPPESHLGEQLGSSLLTVTANRSQSGGAATARWDDEGVETTSFPLVRDGVITEYCTSREHVARLREAYRAQGTPVHSRGCAVADSATAFPIVRLPNLEMAPSTTDDDFDDLVSHVQDGIAIIGGSSYVDQQRLSGQGSGDIMYRIIKGRRGPAITGAAFLFRATDFWKRLSAIGGQRTVSTIGLGEYKGQPSQYDAHSVSAPAGIITNQLVVNVRTRTRLPTP